MSRQLRLPEGFRLDHLSVSQLRTYLMCGYRWYYEYAPTAPKFQDIGWSARLRGNALDAAATLHFMKKAEDGEGLSRQRMVDEAVAIHEAGRDVTMFEIPEGKSRDRVAAQADLFHRTFGTKLSPRSREDIQKWVEGQFYGALDVRVVGKVDLITNDPMVVDVKVKRKVPTVEEVNRDLQFSTYAMLTGVQGGGMALITDEASPQAVFLPTFRRKAQVMAMVDRYNQAAHSILSGALNPAPEGSWYCCEKWCPHWGKCPHGEAASGPREVPGLDE